MQRVVITGMGIYSTIGVSLNEVRDSLFRGKSGIGYDAERKAMGFRSALTGILQRPNLKDKLHRRLRVGLAEEAEYAYEATLQALLQARIDEAFMAHNEIGILYGNDSSARAVVDTIDAMREKKDTTLIGSGSIFRA